MTNKSWFPTWGDRNRDVEHFRGFKTQIDTLFEDWFGRNMGGVLAPRVDVAEDEKAVTLTTEVSGVKENDIDVSLVGDQLTILWSRPAHVMALGMVTTLRHPLREPL